LSFPFATKIPIYCSKEWRNIGMAFEIINTSAPLTKQGLITVYRYPTASLDSAKSTLVVTPITVGPPATQSLGYVDVVHIAQPPITTSTAMLLPGSRQWDAALGAYVVSTRNSSEAPAGTASVSVVMRLDPADPSFNASSTPGVQATQLLTVSSSTFGLGSILTVPTSAPTNVVTFLGAPNTGYMPYNLSGCYITGLGNTNTIQVNATYFFEAFPNHLDADLVVLAKPSPRMDTIALELVSEIMRAMPVGVPQGANGLGDWFADAVSEAANFIAPVLGAIPNPIAQGLSLAARGAGALARQLGGTANRDGLAPASIPRPMPPPAVSRAVVPAGMTYQRDGGMSSNRRQPQPTIMVGRPPVPASGRSRARSRIPVPRGRSARFNFPAS
jgi:hypothetical protein